MLSSASASSLRRSLSSVRRSIRSHLLPWSTKPHNRNSFQEGRYIYDAKRVRSFSFIQGWMSEGWALSTKGAHEGYGPCTHAKKVCFAVETTAQACAPASFSSKPLTLLKTRVPIWGLSTMAGVGSDPPFLSVSVTEPVKMGAGMQAYISYRVGTKTNMQDFRETEKIVIRRFSDFVWLYERLMECYKGAIIPSLPGKNAVEKFRFTAEFIEVRRKALDVFLNRVTAHPELRKSEDLKNFLQADEEIWAMEKTRSTESSVFKKKPSDFMQMLKDVQSRVSDVVMRKEKVVEEMDPEYEKLKNYVVELEDHLAEAQRHSMRLVKRQRESGKVLADFSKAMKLLSQCESGTLKQALGDIADRAEELSANQQKQGLDLLLLFEEPLKEYVGIVQNIKVAMADRAQAFREQQELLEAYSLKKLSLEKLKLLRPEKAGDMEADLHFSKTQCDEAQSRYQKIVNLMNQDMLRFQEGKTYDLGLVLQDFARAQAQLAMSTAETWGTLLPGLNSPSLAREGDAYT